MPITHKGNDAHLSRSLKHSYGDTIHECPLISCKNLVKVFSQKQCKPVSDEGAVITWRRDGGRDGNG